MRATIAQTITRVGRKLFRNTPVQHWPGVTKLYRALQKVRHGDAEVAVSYNGLTFTFPADEITILPSLLENDYEKAEFEYIHEHVKPGMLVLDIGANVGLFACSFAKLVGPTGRVIAIEPEPENIRRLRRHLAQNMLDNVTVIEKAAGSAAATMKLHIVGGSVGTHSLVGNSEESIDVPVVALDEELGNLPVDFIKIDVEGYELQALRGLSNVLNQRRAKLLIELAPSHLNAAATSVDELVAFLRKYFNSLQLFTSGGLRALSEQQMRDLAAGAGTHNLLCSP